jgi:hypothetical protein
MSYNKPEKDFGEAPVRSPSLPSPLSLTTKIIPSPGH